MDRHEEILPQTWKDMKVLDEIGVGSFGTVYMVEDAQGKAYAMKVVRIPGQEGELETIKKEYGDDESVRKYFG